MEVSSYQCEAIMLNIKYSKKGQSLVEYALVIGSVGILVIGSLGFLGDNLHSSFYKINTTLSTHQYPPSGETGFQ